MCRVPRGFRPLCLPDAPQKEPSRTRQAIPKTLTDDEKLKIRLKKGQQASKDLRDRKKKYEADLEKTLHRLKSEASVLVEQEKHLKLENDTLARELENRSVQVKSEDEAPKLEPIPFLPEGDALLDPVNDFGTGADMDLEKLMGDFRLEGYLLDNDLDSVDSELNSIDSMSNSSLSQDDEALMLPDVLLDEWRPDFASAPISTY
eukprot:m.43706 g.43706  ORF g.43706 m.43706 type:complete len:204 (-) comp9998_c0_seq2:2008-2619(-)